MVGSGGVAEVLESVQLPQRPRSEWALAVLREFELYLEGRDDLSGRSRETYSERVKDFLGWLERQPDRTGALSDSTVRDAAVLAYREHLYAERRVAAATINLALVAIDTLYRWRGLGASSVRRVRGKGAGPRPLEYSELSRFLAAAAARGDRDHAICGLLVNHGLSESELHLLDDEFVRITAESGEMDVHSPDGQVRTAILAGSTRALVSRWRAERTAMLRGAPRKALFISRGRRARLALSSIYYLVREVGRDADLEVSPEALRFTYKRRMLECGFDPVLVAGLMGLARPYPTPTHVHPIPRPHDPALAMAVVEAVTVVAGEDLPHRPVLPVRAAQITQQLELFDT
ncbi:tyrosine-type recombinase/integrase [Nocardia takedensis]|uniref:tyrosine-type recombinase/integrase n=1 Tax=Nocardia takedensis TaxID=259390 RepID=UPI003F75D8D4